MAVADNQGRGATPVIVLPSFDPGTEAARQVWKSFNATTAQTGAAIWTPASGKRIAVTSIVIGTYGTTAGRCIVWFGAGGDTTYTEGTDQPVVKASFAPSTTATPGLVQSFPKGAEILCNTADYVLRITTDAALSVDIVVYGYEY